MPADDVPAVDVPAVDVALVDAGLLLEEQAPASTITAKAAPPDKSRRLGAILAILSGFVRPGRWIQVGTGGERDHDGFRGAVIGHIEGDRFRLVGQLEVLEPAGQFLDGDLEVHAGQV